MSAAHTPGPWELARNDAHAGSIATLYGGVDGYIEVWTTKWPEGVDQEANARLIAAAPELLSLLEDAVASFGPHIEGGDDEWLKFATAAILKATGSAA